MADPAVVISHDEIGRDLHHAAEAEAKAKEEAEKARKGVRDGWLGLAATVLAAVLFHRVTLSHLGTLGCVFAAVVCFAVAVVIARRAVDQPDPTSLTPPWIALALRDVRTGDAVYDDLAGGTKHFTGPGALEKAKGAAASLAEKEAAVTRAHLYLVLGALLAVAGFLAVAFTPTIGLVAIVVIVLAAARFAA